VTLRVAVLRAETCSRRPKSFPAILSNSRSDCSEVQRIARCSPASGQLAMPSHSARGEVAREVGTTAALHGRAIYSSRDSRLNKAFWREISIPLRCRSDFPSNGAEPIGPASKFLGSSACSHDKSFIAKPSRILPLNPDHRLKVRNSSIEIGRKQNSRGRTGSKVASVRRAGCA
jgi:hypothetical protein